MFRLRGKRSNLGKVQTRRKAGAGHPPPEAEPGGTAGRPPQTCLQGRGGAEWHPRESKAAQTPPAVRRNPTAAAHLLPDPANNSWELPRLAGLPPAAPGPGSGSRTPAPRTQAPSDLDTATSPGAAQPGQLLQGPCPLPSLRCRRMAATTARSDAATKKKEQISQKNSERHLGIHTARYERIRCSLGVRVTQRRGRGQGDGAT